MKENYFLKFHNFSLYGFKKEKKTFFTVILDDLEGSGKKRHPLRLRLVGLNWIGQKITCM